MPAYQSFQELGVSQAGDNDEMMAIMNLSLGLSTTFYDTLDLTLAERLSCYYVTADRALYDRVKGKMSRVVWIGDVG